MRAFLITALAALLAALVGCAAGQSPARTSPVVAPVHLSINQYNQFDEARQDNNRTLIQARKAMAGEADPREIYALSLLIRTMEKHAAVSRNLADLALLAETKEFAGSPYLRSRFEETARMLEDDLGEIEMQNLVLNKSNYKGVSAVYTGYINDLEQLIGLIRSDIEKLPYK